VKSYYRMLRRNLIYTAITRSKQFLILVGEEDALKMGIERGVDTERNTTLVEKLIQMLPELSGDQDVKLESHQVFENKEAPAEMIKTTDEVDYLEMIKNADPMIGMENVSPYDFMEERS
jgi:exodeoxyribonuclease V alpha subunit